MTHGTLERLIVLTVIEVLGIHPEELNEVAGERQVKDPIS